MLRRLPAAFISIALVLGAASPSTFAASDKNQAPLPPGKAAGIKQAQGGQVDPLLAGGIVVGVFAISALLIGDNDNDHEGGTVTTTGTH
jgi:hypothetical protein